MKIADLVKTVSSMTEDELVEHLRRIRHSRETVRPAAKRYIEKAETKASRGRVAGVEKLLAGLSEVEREELLKQLEQEKDNG